MKTTNDDNSINTMMKTTEQIRQQHLIQQKRQQ